MILDKTILETFPFWDKLQKKDQEDILADSYVRKYEKGNIIHTKEGECLGIIQVLDGYVRTYMVSDEGKEITLYDISKGEVDVLSASCVLHQITFDTQLVAREDTTILVIPVTVLSRLKEENPYVRSYIYEVLADRFSDVMWTMQQILFLKMDQRLATYLLDESSRTGTNVLHVTHEEIAQEINSAREVVARMMKQFQKDGLIESRRGEIEIKEKTKLRNLL